MSKISPESINAQSVDFYINTKCNLSCTTCFLGDEYFRADKAMSLESVSNYIDFLNKTNVKDVAILGGESTLHPNFIDLLALFQEKVPHWTVRLVSNGNRFARTKFPQYQGLLDAIYVSLDSPHKERNDIIRGAGSYCDAVGLLNLTVSSELSAVLNMCISRKNRSDMAEMFKFAIELGVDRLNIHWTSPTGRAANSGISLNLEEWADCLAEFKIFAKAYEKMLRSDIQTAYNFSEEEVDFGCMIKGMNNIQIFPDGSVYLCGLHVDDPQMSSIFSKKTKLFLVISVERQEY